MRAGNWTMTDWTQVEAKKLAEIARKHGLRSRVVICKLTDSYTAIYRESDDEGFAEKYKAMRDEAQASGWTGYEKIVRL